MSTKRIGVDLGGTKFEAGRLATGVSVNNSSLEFKHREKVNSGLNSDELSWIPNKVALSR